MKNNLITFGTVLTMLASSCSPGVNTAEKELEHQKRQAQKNPSVVVKTAWDNFQAIIEGQNSNIPLAEALLPMFQSQSPNVVSEFRKKIESGQLSIEGAELEKWDALKKSLLIRNSPISADAELLSETLNLNLEEFNRSNAFSHQLNFKIYGLVQSVALQNILSMYDQQISHDSLDIAADVIAELNQSNPSLIDRIDSTKTIKNRTLQIEQITMHLIQAEKIFIKYKFSDDAATKLTIYSAVAGALAVTLAKQPSVKTLITEASQVVQQVKELSAKADRVVKLSKEVSEFGSKLTRDAKMMTESIKNIYDKVNKIDKDIKYDLSLSEKDKKAAKKLLNDLVNSRNPSELIGEASDSLKGTSIFTKQRELDADFVKFIESAKNSAQSVENILSNAKVIAETLGIKVSKKVDSAILTAQKISKGFEAAKAISTAFSAGGYMGALAAFSGGPVTLALAGFSGGLGGGGPDPAIMGELAGIKQTLNEIKEMQQEILDNQKKTMAMIKDLALMVEENHRTEMYSIMEVRDGVNAVKDALTALDEKNGFLSCRVMISSGIGNIPSSAKVLNVANLDFIKAKIRENTSTTKTFNAFVQNKTPTIFEDCRHELSISFASDTFIFSRAAWSEADSDGDPLNGERINSRFYEPALFYLNFQLKDKETRWDRLGLHLPVLTVPALKLRKSGFLNQPHSNIKEGLKELQVLTATNKLEKYVTALLVLHPYLSTDLETWSKPLPETLNILLSEGTQKNTQDVLGDALKKVQISIAQEALLAGEPLLPSLSLNWSRIMGQNFDCRKKENDEYCFVRENSLMMQNLLTYTLVERIGVLGTDAASKGLRKEKYKILLADPKLLAELLYVTKARIQKSADGSVKLNLSSFNDIASNYVDLPSVEAIEHAQIQYTEAMSRMIKLEHKIADELVKVTPVFSNSFKTDLAATMFAK